MFPLRKFLTKVWRGERFEIGEIISFLELNKLNNATAIAEILKDLAEREIWVNKAEELLEEATKCTC